jgi:hypothetical protein
MLSYQNNVQKYCAKEHEQVFKANNLPGKKAGSHFLKTSIFKTFDTLK